MTKLQQLPSEAMANGHFDQSNSGTQTMCCNCCNAPICPQLATHRVSSCGTHRVVTHSWKMRFSAHGTSCAASPICCSSKEACSEEQGTIVSRRWSMCRNGCIFLDRCDNTCAKEHVLFCFLLTRVIVVMQSHNKLCNWHADSSHLVWFGLVNLLRCGWAFCPSHFAPTVKVGTT